MKCNCKYCKDIDYDNSEYFVDLSLLTNERPIGVSGLLRVKNDAEFLALCVDSCIDALDELIIVYQECDDDSPQIIEQKRQQYPDKIRTYFYRPLVLSHNLTSEELHYVSTLDKTSIHLLSNYYNYTLSKASYRYAIKIDGDQVYFKDKLKSFCNAYRKEKIEKITIGERWSSAYIYNFVSLMNLFPKLLSSKLSFLIPSKKIVDRYKHYELKIIANKKYPVSFSGINLYKESGDWALPLGAYAEGMFPPFNGIHDHILFEISAVSFYLPHVIYSNNFKYGNCIIETFNLDKKLSLPKGFYKPQLLYGGFLWYHAAAIKEPEFTTNREKYKQSTLPLFDKKVNFFDLEMHLSIPFRRWMRPWYCLFWNKEWPELPKNDLSKINNIISVFSNIDLSNEKKKR